MRKNVTNKLWILESENDIKKNNMKKMIEERNNQEIPAIIVSESKSKLKEILNTNKRNFCKGNNEKKP